MNNSNLLGESPDTAKNGRSTAISNGLGGSAGRAAAIAMTVADRDPGVETVGSRMISREGAVFVVAVQYNRLMPSLYNITRWPQADLLP